MSCGPRRGVQKTWPMTRGPWAMLSGPWPVLHLQTMIKKKKKNSQARDRTLQAIAYRAKPPKATIHANSPASGPEKHTLT